VKRGHAVGRRLQLRVRQRQQGLGQVRDINRLLRTGHHEALEEYLWQRGYGRVIALEGQLRSVIERRVQARSVSCPYVFHRLGRPMGEFRKAVALAPRGWPLGRCPSLADYVTGDHAQGDGRVPTYYVDYPLQLLHSFLALTQERMSGPHRRKGS